MLIDFHTHAYPDKIAERTVEFLGKEGNIPYFTNGTLNGLKEKLSSDGVNYHVLLNIATTPKHESKVNEFAISSNGGNCFAFGSVHPYSDTWKQSLQVLKDAKIAGVKFHNEYQNFFVDDEKAMPIYAECEKLGLIMLFHGGGDIAFKPPYKCSPKSFANVAKEFPNAKFVFAHLGGLHTQKESIEYLSSLKNVYTDTAFSSQYYSVAAGREIVDAFGADRVLFGSDCPWDTPLRTVEYVKSLGLSSVEEEKIFYKNAENLLKI